MKQTIQAQKVHTPELSPKAKPEVATPWLTFEEAAAYAKVSRRTVEGWAYQGMIPVYYPTAKPRLKKVDIDKYFESKKREPIAAS
jgi:excisionase family DNA binding protein